MEVTVIQELSIDEYGLEKETASSLENSFLPFFEQAKEWKEKAEGLVVTSLDQKEEMKQAREARLALKNIRVEANKTRKALKEDSIKYGKAVQGLYNVIDYLISPIEKHLEEQEKFAEIQEANQKAELKAKREVELTPFEEFVPVQIDLANMSEEDYRKLFSGAKLQFEAKIEAEGKAEQEKIEKEAKEAAYRNRRNELTPFYQFGILDKLSTETTEENFKSLLKEGQEAKQKFDAEQEKIKAENERLRKEKEAAEAKAKAEREIAEKKAAKEKAEVEAKAKAEREAREKLEAELKAKKDAEDKRLKEELEAKKKAELAPDKEKLVQFAESLKNLSTPSVNSEEASKVIASSKELISKTVKYILDKSEQL